MRLVTFLSLAICVALMSGGFFLASSADAIRKRDQEEQDRLYEQDVIKNPFASREAKGKAIEALVIPGISIAQVSKIVDCTPWKTETIPNGVVLSEFGIIAREELVVCRWRVWAGDLVEAIHGQAHLDLAVVFSHKRNAAIDKKVAKMEETIGGISR